MTVYERSGYATSRTEARAIVGSPTVCREVHRRFVNHQPVIRETPTNLPAFAAHTGYAVCTDRQVPPENSARVASRRRLLLLAERFTLALGLIGLVAWGWFEFRTIASARHDVERFAVLRAAAQQSSPPIDSTLDQSLWSPLRIREWRKATAEPAPAPLAVLRIPKIRLEVPVLPGTDDRTLDRAVGHIDYSPQPGSGGNSGIAGHRDSFFRGLKDVVPGDVIELDTLQGTDVYRVERTWIVSPEDVWVLDPTPTQALTLVTCYPFYFVGSAPQRFIVRAVRVDRPVAFTSLNR